MGTTNFGDKLKRIRKSKGLTQVDLSTLMGWTDRSTIAHMESGRNIPTIGMVEKLAKALNVSPVVFFHDEPDNRIADIIPYLETADDATLTVIRRVLGIPVK